MLRTLRKIVSLDLEELGSAAHHMFLQAVVEVIHCHAMPSFGVVRIAVSTNHLLPCEQSYIHFSEGKKKNSRALICAFYEAPQFWGIGASDGN